MNKFIIAWQKLQNGLEGTRGTKMASNFKQSPSSDFIVDLIITTDKYDRPLAQCRDKGWKTWNFPVEIRCRGFLAQSE